MECSTVSDVAWMKRQIGQVVQAELNWSTQIQGVSPGYFSVRNWPVESGAVFGPRDEESANRVVLLGKTVVENLFGPGEDPIGAMIRVKDVPFRVIGVLARKGQTSWGQDQDDTVVIPFSTAERRVLGSEIPRHASTWSSPRPRARRTLWSRPSRSPRCCASDTASRRAPTTTSRCAT